MACNTETGPSRVCPLSAGKEDLGPHTETHLSAKWHFLSHYA